MLLLNLRLQIPELPAQLNLKQQRRKQIFFCNYYNIKKCYGIIMARGSVVVKALCLQTRKTRVRFPMRRFFTSRPWALLSL
jgi:hypothetical protein